MYVCIVHVDNVNMFIIITIILIYAFFTKCLLILLEPVFSINNYYLSNYL